jgi:hypothetical protein
MAVRRYQFLTKILFLFSIPFVKGENGTEQEKTDCTAFLIGEFTITYTFKEEVKVKVIVKIAAVRSSNPTPMKIKRVDSELNLRPYF